MANGPENHFVFCTFTALVHFILELPPIAHSTTSVKRPVQGLWQTPRSICSSYLPQRWPKHIHAMVCTCELITAVTFVPYLNTQCWMEGHRLVTCFVSQTQTTPWPDSVTQAGPRWTSAAQIMAYKQTVGASGNTHGGTSQTWNSNMFGLIQRHHSGLPGTLRPFDQTASVSWCHLDRLEIGTSSVKSTIMHLQDPDCKINR